MPTPCPFCTLPPARILWADALCFAFHDAFPVTPGHTLIVPKRHVATWFDATPEEKQALWQAVDAIKALLDRKHAPDGYNLGINAGEAAGQTVPHLHLHVIPRTHGDTPNPRGGVRGVIPAKQDYTRADTPTPDPSDPFAALPSFVAGEDDPLLTPLREALREAETVDIVAAFAQHSGIDLLEGDWVDALHRGTRLRVLTSDYLNITSAHALQRLLTLHTTHSAFEARLYETTRRPSFHPKAYLFARGPHGIAYVGSSNLSRTALTDGVEWNLRATDARAFRTVQARFERLFDAATPLTPALVEAYQERVPVPPAPEPAAERPEPHDIQREVLEALRRSRDDGHRAGLVVMATGTGKTFLSAFDFRELDGRRALFVAHRQEILDQAADTWRKVHPHRSIGKMVGSDRTPDADLLFASVQTLSQARHLRTFDPTHFDYVVIDEFHHAAASSYRKLLAHFRPRFLLGLTATPDRMDGAALLDLCGDHLVARIGLVEGIQRKRLVPFAYHGVADSVVHTAQVRLDRWRVRLFGVRCVGGRTLGRGPGVRRAGFFVTAAQSERTREHDGATRGNADSAKGARAGAGKKMTVARSAGLEGHGCSIGHRLGRRGSPRGAAIYSAHEEVRGARVLEGKPGRSWHRPLEEAQRGLRWPAKLRHRPDQVAQVRQDDRQGPQARQAALEVESLRDEDHRTVDRRPKDDDGRSGRAAG